MKKIGFIFAFITTVCIAQSKDSISNKYLEDQLYVGITYNTLNGFPKGGGIAQNGFSNGIFLGFIKDLPINEQRNIGFGLGFGYGRNTYLQNLQITEVNNRTEFDIVSDFKRNKFTLHTLEIPIEFRLRTSTIDKYKFWRIYTGMKLAYVFASNAKLKKDGTTTKVRGISEIENFQYGLTIGAGYGTWNLNIYYGISEIFSGAQLKDSSLAIIPRDLRIGLIFYIL
jgi:hypothetical protein